MSTTLTFNSTSTVKIQNHIRSLFKLHTSSLCNKQLTKQTLFVLTEKRKKKKGAKLVCNLFNISVQVDVILLSIQESRLTVK